MSDDQKIENSDFAALLSQYDEADTEVARLKDERDRADAARGELRGQLRQEVINLGFGRGTRLNVDGVGVFNFTTKTYYSLPAEYREEMVKLLIDEGAISLLTIGQADLGAWCQDRIEREVPIPHYVVIREDKFVPSITLESARVRRQEKRKAKAGGTQ